MTVYVAVCEYRNSGLVDVLGVFLSEKVANEAVFADKRNILHEIRANYEVIKSEINENFREEILQNNG